MKLAGLLTLLALLSLSAAFAVEPAEVALYECRPCATAPVIDGRLDDACWASLPAMDQFFKYWTPIPQAPPLKTAARLCYDARGLYMGVTMFEDQMDKIKATVHSRDDPLTWEDDCVEIMVEPLNTGSSYYKFTTNFNAARHDQKSSNLVLDDGWSVEGWQVKTARCPEGWTIEFFLPWTDVDAKPRPGNIWSFDLVRYGYSSGGFKGASWALGGSGAAPAKFGYLYFGPLPALNNSVPNRLAAVIRPVKGDSFRFIVGHDLVTHDPDGKWQREDIQAWRDDACKLAWNELTQAQAALQAAPAGPDRERLSEGFKAVALQMPDEVAGGDPPVQPADAVVRHYHFMQLVRQVADVKWGAKVLELVATAGK